MPMSFCILSPSKATVLCPTQPSLCKKDTPQYFTATLTKPGNLQTCMSCDDHYRLTSLRILMRISGQDKRTGTPMLHQRFWVAGEIFGYRPVPTDLSTPRETPVP